MRVAVTARLEFISSACELTEVYADLFLDVTEVTVEQGDSTPKTLSAWNNLPVIPVDIASSHSLDEDRRNAGHWAIRTALLKDVIPNIPFSVPE